MYRHAHPAGSPGGYTHLQSQREPRLSRLCEAVLACCCCCCVVQGLLGDRLVHLMYLEAFTQQAAYLLDQAAVQEAAEVFWSSYVPDERMPASPTRR